MSHDFADVRRLFTRAAQLPEAERAAFLERECGADAELLTEVASLLATFREEDELLEPPSGAALAALLGTSRASLPGGSRLGPYVLVRVLASGGMGVVYEATRESPRRRVALKVMRLGLAGDSSVRRFRHEAEILAGLRHPSIATVYETGVHVDAGREVPWFAMEFVEGARSIVDYVEAEQLGLEQRLRLFGEVCDAVHHGHMQGVIHRDLKPDNILVDRSGRPRVIDFGVARATGSDLALSTLQTEAGAIVGTLATMSPEQVGGDRAALDLRTDVYSLGVVLYRILTGRLPHDFSGVPLPEVARTIREVAPMRAGELDTRLRGDLETILNKALEKEPPRRYASAAALREDLERYLAGEPILARPPSLGYQAQLFARRHRALSAAAVLVAVAAVIATFVSLRFAFRARQSAEQSARRFDIVRDVGRDLLYGVLAELEELQGGTEARAKIAATAANYLDALSREAGDDVALLRDLFAGYSRLGSFQGDPDAASLGTLREAHASYARANAIAFLILELDATDTAVRREAHGNVLALGALLVRLGETERARTHFEDTLRAAEREGYVELAASAHIHLGDLASSRGEDDEALARFTTARDLLQGRGAEQAENLAVAESRLANLALKAQRFEAAEQHLDTARVGMTSTLDEIGALCDRAGMEERRGNAEGSLELGRSALELARGLVASDPDDAVARERLAWSLDVVGVAQRLLREFGAAEASFGESLELYRSLAERDPSNLHARTLAAEMQAKLAGAMLPQGRFEEARDLAAEAARELEAILARDPAALDRQRQLCLALDVHAQALLERWELDEAARVLDRFLEVAQVFADRAADDANAQHQMLLVHDRMGVVHQRVGEDEARPVADRIAAYERAVEAYGQCLGTFDTLRERGFLYPGDEQAAPHVEQAMLTCDEARERLEAE